MEKILIDKNRISTTSNFKLNISEFKELKELNLNLDDAIKEFYSELNTGNFEKAKKLINLANRLSEYGNENVDRMTVDYLYNVIMDKNENIEEQYQLYSKFIFIEDFLKKVYLISNTNKELGLDDKTNEVKKLKSEIIDNICYEVKNNNLQYRIADIENLEKIYEVSKDERLKNILLMVIDKVNISLKASDLDDNKIKDLLKYKYEVEFLNSKEFENTIVNYDFENYSAFLEYINKAYLMYIYRNNNDKDKLFEAIYNSGVKGFIKLSILEREFVFNEIKKVKNDNNNLVDEINNIVLDLISKRSNEYIPI